MIPNTPSPLKGKRLRLMPFHERHLTQAYVDWLNTPETMRYSEQRHKQHDLNSCRQFQKHMADTKHFVWAIEELQTERHIGNIAIYIDRNNKVGDLTILIGDPHAVGKGYGIEASAMACEWLLDAGGLRKVTAGTMANNTAMLKIMKHIGMHEEGRRKKQFLCEGREVDLVLGARFKTAPHKKAKSIQ